MYKQGSGTDNLAGNLIDHVSLFGKNIPGSLWYTQFYLLLARFYFYVTGRIFTDQLAKIIIERKKAQIY